MTITIVGLGPGNPASLTVGALEALRSGRPVLLRTAVHPTVDRLRSMGISFSSCDDIYEAGSSFEEVYDAVAHRVLTYDDVVFAVPGHPMVAEESVRRVLARAGDEAEIIAGPSFLDALLTALRLDPVDGLELLDALQLHHRIPSGDLPAIVMQVHSRAVASDTKLALMQRYPDDHAVTLVRAAGVPDRERVLQIRLHQLDHYDWVDYLTSLYLPPLPRPEVGETDPRRWLVSRWPADPLVEVMERLRGPHGCPWDKEQTHLSLRKYMLEEAYEVVEAATAENPDQLCEELGDVLLQVVFHAQMAREHGQFDFHDIVEAITAKLVRRHPHVFGDVQADTPAEVTRNWEAIKQAEKGVREASGTLEGVSAGLPALMRAFEIQRRAAKVGFDWETVDGPAAKVQEELKEVLSASPDQVAGEVGDLLFAVINLSRLLKVDPEIALTATNAKFVDRFSFVERRAAERGLELQAMTLEELDAFWNEAKKAESQQKYRKKPPGA